MSDDRWRLNPKFVEWVDMFRSWGISASDSFELVFEMWDKLPLDVRLEKGKEELK